MALIRGISFDFDGSLSRIKGDIILQNLDFLNFIRAQNHKYAETYAFIGSNRQSIYDDSMNALSNKNGSCYPQIRKVSDYIGAKFDPFTLTDLYNNLKSGESFKLALSFLKNDMLNDNEESYAYDPSLIKQRQTPDWLHDESKLSLLLAQIHKLASEHPEDEIEFYFYDDQKKILDRLNAFFSIPENRRLLPKNLKELHLIPYPDIPKELDEKDTLKKNKKRDSDPFLLAKLDNLKIENKADGNLSKQPDDFKEENVATSAYSKKESLETQFISYPPISGIGEIDFNFRQTVQTMAAVCIESERYQNTFPTDFKANLVRSYAQAERGNFVLSTVMNFALDYVFGLIPKVFPAPVPAELKTLSLESTLPLHEPLASRLEVSEPVSSRLFNFLPGFLKSSKAKEEKDKEKKEQEEHLKDKKKKSAKKIEPRITSAQPDTQLPSLDNSSPRSPVTSERFFAVVSKPQRDSSAISLSAYRESNSDNSEIKHN
ncbi:hypothetical protein [Legionella maceachernii]|uniref:Dot/Icm T4SS effector n=2 Tax=Legionella maceachernii TaxID=466 RepID=A0A0W0WHV2_9GAMM|nr:hypothetical protein [Legionella maceachernii]KTD31915.1 Dot/Icm T4SS effector [Legionella maceachernii]SKA30723.1 hypothetical protein SAMN02745128_03222 [Legionella maceachernii]SUP01811.1 Uncharacterised protein [Legionella maceachernii]